MFGGPDGSRQRRQGAAAPGKPPGPSRGSKGRCGLGEPGSCGLDPGLRLPEPGVPGGASEGTLLGITFSAFRLLISSTSPYLVFVSVVFSAVSV